MDDFKDMNLTEVLALAYSDYKIGFKFLFPDTFYADFIGLHDQILNLIQSNHRQVAIAAPRGIGKTTIARAVAMMGILFQDINFIVYISRSATMAEMQTENIKRELLTNKRVKALFGDVRASESGLAEDFSKKAWVAFGNTLVLPRGAGQQVRGINWRNHRPQLIIVDDLEDKDEVRNEQNRENLKQWFFSDVLKSVNRFKNDWRVIYIDTIKHQDSLLENLMNASDWKSVRLAICDENYKSLAPSYMTDEELQAEVEAHREKGLLDLFYMEYMNQVVAGEDATFKPAYFKYYDESDPEFIKKVKAGKIESVLLVDPAKTAKMHNASSACVVVGVDVEDNVFYIRDIVHGKLHPDELYDHIFRLVDFYRLQVVGVEVTGLNEFVTYPIKNEMIRRGKIFDLVELKARRGVGEYSSANRGKEGRIASLVPLYRQGLIYHNKNVSGPLEQQLLSFPRSAEWDIMDATAYLVELMEMGLRYFLPKEASESPEDIEKEYEELLTDEDKQLLPDWRI